VEWAQAEAEEAAGGRSRFSFLPNLEQKVEKSEFWRNFDYIFCKRKRWNRQDFGCD